MLRRLARSPIPRPQLASRQAVRALATSARAFAAASPGPQTDNMLTSQNGYYTSEYVA